MGFIVTLLYPKKNSKAAKLLIGFIAVVFSINMLGLLFLFSAPKAQAISELFNDGFESSDFSSWNSVDSPEWEVVSDDPYAGDYRAHLSNSDETEPEEDVLLVGVSTEGYESLTLSFWYRLVGDLEGTDSVVVEWSSDGGSTWDTLVTHNDEENNESEWAFVSVGLSAGAEDNGDFQLRFKADLNAASEEFHLDDVLLEGDEIEQEEQEENDEVLGSIRVCKIIVDENGDPIKGISWSGATFSISGMDTETSFGSADGVFGTVEFDAPLNFTDDLLGQDGVKDAECSFTITDLPLGNYYYDEEVTPSSWLGPQYNDGDVTHGTSLEEYFDYSGELFDEDEENDEDRNTDSDGHITLTENSPNRSLIIVNRPTGSIKVCKVLLDEDGNIIDGSDLDETTFSISGLIPAISSKPLPLIVPFGTENFTLPLNFTDDFLTDNDGDKDAECSLTYTNLPLGHYYYDEEVLPDGDWEDPRYDDEDKTPLESISSFVAYDPNLFDGDESNDEDRNTDSDGHIVLTSSRPNRTLTILNQVKAEPDEEEECQEDCDSGGGGGGPSEPTCEEDESIDCTPPVSQFDNNRSHFEIVDTEILPLNLSGNSTDDISGVQSAVMEIYQVADEETVLNPNFDEQFEGMNCSELEQVPIEIVSLSLVSVDPLTVTWAHDWTPSSMGVFCFEVHATDFAGNIENTALAGPIAMTVPVPTPSPTPTTTPNGSGGGSGGSGPQGNFINGPLTNTPQVAGASTVATPTPHVAGELTVLPETGFGVLGKILFSLFGLMLFSGVILLMIGYGKLPARLTRYIEN